MSHADTYKVIYRGRDGHDHVIFVQSMTEAWAYTDARKEIGKDLFMILKVEKM